MGAGDRKSGRTRTTALSALRRSGSRNLAMLLTGMLLGTLVTLPFGDRFGPAELYAWLGATSAKTGDRLGATAEVTEFHALTGGCTALVLNRLTGLTAAVACSSAMPASARPLRAHEIES